MKSLVAALVIVLLACSTASATWPCCTARPVVVQSPVVAYSPVVCPVPPPRPVRYHYGPIRRLETYAVPVAAPVPLAAPATVTFSPGFVAPGAPYTSYRPAWYPVPTYLP